MSIFNSIPLPKLKRSKFNLSHDVKLTANMGTLIPVLCQPVLPGDKWNVSTQFLCRTSPMLAPVMHRINIYFHTFFVPNRLLWDNWEDFITQGVNGEDKPVLPYTTPRDIFMLGRYTVTEGSKRVEKYDNSGSLADYLGLPVQMFDFRDITPDQGTQISLLPFAAYQLIYQEYYKDENLETDEFRKLTDGYTENQHVITDYLSLRSRCWRKDYFAGALPWPQRLADSEVTLPIAGNANIKKEGQFNDNVGKLLISETGAPPLSIEIDGSGFLKAKGYGGTRADAGIDLNQLLSADQISHLKADLSSGNSVTINQLREAVRLQIWLENNARGGSRYIEQLMAHFGVQSSDARLQRPEYLGGYSSDLNISEVLQTSESTENSPQGKQTGHGFSIAGSGGNRKYFEEHGYIMTIMSIRPQNSYMQGIPKDFTKTDNLEFYFPEFQHLGEQEVKEKEIFYIKEGTQTKPVTVSNEDTFGYVPRYAEYKTIPNRVCGDFRDSMDYYHLARKFDTAPTLSSQFMHVEEISWRPRGSGNIPQDNPVQENLARIFATFYDPQSKKPYQHYWFDIGFDITCSRKMSKYGIPKLI